MGLLAAPEFRGMVQMTTKSVCRRNRRSVPDCVDLISRKPRNFLLQNRDFEPPHLRAGALRISEKLIRMLSLQFRTAVLRQLGRSPWIVQLQHHLSD